MDDLIIGRKWEDGGGGKMDVGFGWAKSLMGRARMVERTSFKGSYEYNRGNTPTNEAYCIKLRMEDCLKML